MEKIDNLVVNLHNKNEHVIHIRKLKQVLNHGLFLKKKYHRVIKFNHKTWLKPYLVMNTDTRKKRDFEKHFF